MNNLTVCVSAKLFGATGCTTFSGENYIFVQKFIFVQKLHFCTEITFFVQKLHFCTEIALSPIAVEEVNIRAYLDFSYNEQIKRPLLYNGCSATK